MGYLYDNLPFGRDIAECPAFYIYAMFIYFERADRFAADKPKTILAQTIQRVLPDVEDWQVSVVREDHVVFRFHDPAQRQQALDAVLSSTPVELVVQKVTFESQGSTVLPSGQVFPAPAPPPPPFPDLGPIIDDLETRVHQLELDEEGEVIGSGVKVREVDGFPVVDPTKTIIVPNNTLTLGGPDEAILDFNSFELREVVIGPFVETVVPDTAINIRTGAYGGGLFSPAPVSGDLNVTLPASGAAFKDDGRIEVHLNGQDLPKGDGSGNGIAEWVSATQIKMRVKVKNKDTIMVRAPFPTA